MKKYKLSQAMLDFLKKWEKETANHDRLTAKIEKYVYDKTFFTEQRGIGEIKYEKPDKAMLKLSPQEVKGLKSKETKADGNPYTLQGITPERWVCTGKEIFQIDDKEKTFRVVRIPPNQQGGRINEGPIPFLFGLSAEEAQRRYHFYGRKPNPRFENSFSFRAVPQRRVDAQEYKYADVILDTVKFVPIAIRLTDPTENSVTVYYFRREETEVNPKKRFWDRGPFIDLNLKGYKLVGNPGVPGPAPNGQLPAGGQPGNAQPRAAQPRAGRVRITDGQKEDRK